MAYQRTVWQEGVTYGPSNFNNIEEGIIELEKQLGGATGYNRKQIENMSKALKKLRMNEGVEICFMGDSVFYAYDQSEQGVPEDCIPDNGSPLTGYKRCPVTIYDSFMDVVNRVYENTITLKKKIFTGDTVIKAYDHWNACKSDFIIINFGINDAMGGHVDQVTPNYRGQVDKFVAAYRKLIEREIANGTAVILLSPTKQTLLTEGTDKDNRVLIDIYEQAVFELAKEYDCVCIDGNEMVKNFGNDLSIDFCHFTQEGFKAIGQRLASIFIGQSPSRPLVVHGGSYLGVNPQLDNVNLVNRTILTNSDISPNLPMMISSGDLANPVVRVGKGLQATVTGNGSIWWSFYCEQDGMVVIPSLYTKDVNLGAKIKLNYGSKQGKWNNYWNCISANGTIDRNYEEPTLVEINYSDLVDHPSGTGKMYGLHMLNKPNQPVLKITTKGWHSIEIVPKFPLATQDDGRLRSVIPDPSGEEQLLVFGLNFLTLDEYKRKVMA